MNKNTSVKSTPENKFSVTLRIVPPEIKKMILMKQGVLRSKCKCIVSQEKAVYTIIKEWMNYRKEEKKLKKLTSSSVK